MSTLDFNAGRNQAEILIRALPHMLNYDEAKIVIKFGGSAMSNDKITRHFATDIVLLEQSGVNPLVVHGGGPQIGQLLGRLGIKSQFVNGMRVTDKETMEIVEMVLAGAINKQIVGAIGAAGGKALGLCGKDANMVRATKLRAKVRDKTQPEITDLGLVGEPSEIDCTVLNQIMAAELIPVLAPIAQSRDGVTYNINADIFAGDIDSALKARRLIFLSDVPGVLDGNGKLISELHIKDIKSLIADGLVKGGMIPKLETCVKAITHGVEGVVILDGSVPHALLVELLTDHGAGTLIKA